MSKSFNQTNQDELIIYNKDDGKLDVKLYSNEDEILNKKHA